MGTDLSIRAGQSLLHYRVVEKIGEGGMGVVWRAIDTTLDREVAIKLLPATLAGDAERLARFEREAKLLASLNHPNIATLHGLHEAPDSADPQRRIRFLVMELVDGEDLSERLARGPIPLDEALGVARQIAEGLEAAHGAGVIHRDLKPANVKIGAEGRVKVLDFGLARAFETGPTSGEVSPTMSPTLTSAGTLAGVILGTAAYMSPEQARGHVVDSRADIWAFGVVLYEMLSGRTAFRGETVSDTLASVLKLDPDFDALPPTVPNRIRRLVTRCLQKDRKKRLHHIADARIALDETLAGVPDEAAPDASASRTRRARERLLWLAGALVVGVAAATAAWILKPAASEPPHRKIVLALDGVDPAESGIGNHVISPDGTRIAYTSGERVFVRDLNDWDSREIAAASGASKLFWSHDGESLGFVAGKKLSRVSAAGGGGSLICDLPGGLNDASWGADGRIILSADFDDQAGIYAVSERGGEPKAVLLPENDDEHYHGVDVLPGGRGVLVTVHRGKSMILSILNEGRLTALLELETNYLPQPVYSATGHVLYRRGDTNEGIWALPISLETLEVTGEPFLVAADAGRPSVSRDGTLIYSEGGSRMRRLVWVDRQGKILEQIGHPQEGFGFPALSPEGGRVAVSAGADNERDIWIVDLTRGTMTRLTSDEERETDPSWTQDGKRVVYRQRPEDGPTTIMATSVDGSGVPEKLVEGDLFSLSPDGRFLIFSRRGEETEDDLWFLRLDVEGDPEPIVQTAADEQRGRVSPDGTYIAYESDESGEDEIYLKRFPSGEGKWQASIDGGTDPYWSPEGDELFWVDDGDLMVVEVHTGVGLTLGTPRRLFSWRPPWMLGYLEFEVAPDAQRFVLVAAEGEDENSNTIRFVESWLTEK